MPPALDAGRYTSKGLGLKDQRSSAASCRKHDAFRSLARIDASVEAAYIERHIELDGDSHGPMGRELLEGLVADSPQRDERALRAACNSIKARIELWNGTLNTLRDMRTKKVTSVTQATARQMGETPLVSRRAS